jgi:hypothetical protein
MYLDLDSRVASHDEQSTRMDGAPVQWDEAIIFIEVSLQ